MSPPGLSKSLSSRGVAVAGDALVLLALLAVAPAAAARPRVPGGGGAPLAPPGGGAAPGKALFVVLATGCVAVDEPRGPRGAFIAEWTHWGDTWVFVLSLLAIAPFAERLSFVTEQLALHTSETPVQI